MSFGFRFRPFVLQFFQFSWGEFIRIRDAYGGLRLRFTFSSIQFNRCRLNRLDNCPTLIIVSIDNGVPIFSQQGKQLDIPTTPVRQPYCRVRQMPVDITDGEGEIISKSQSLFPR
ncbi:MULTISPECIES: hypothetical protein [Nostoc]|uniref:Uncharacterized protein n=2 Tax=Nostoc TaxID=1177 RepID=A0ABR8IJJ3_9NOSO|nr:MULTISPECIES: hypothetical protein [Nostoc]MBD2563851.1 hypothetical protein [Nostoc linckia FACHB-391]MBD2651049.1 hypothetical protein [Nostoc foliaceum FACHB-393]